MATLTIRPTATASNTGSWSAVGAATLHAAANDSSDATYILRPDDGVNTTEFELTMGDVTIPALAQIRSMQMFVRGYAIATASPPGSWFVFPRSIAWEYGVKLTNTSIATVAGPILTTDPSTGVAWTAAVLNAYNFGGHAAAYTAHPAPGGGWHGRVHDVWVDVITNEAPVATVSAPTGNQGSSRPTVTWAYSDPESNAQERYRIKVFSAAQYGIGGFSAETSPYTWDSGEVFSAAVTAPVGADLVNGVTYKAYVKVADTGSGGRYGEWAAGPAFTIATTPPPVPTFTATAEPTLARVFLHAVAGTFAPAAQRIIIERSADAGATWAIIRGGNEITPVATIVDVYDYEVPRGVDIMRYRARSVADVTGNRLVSANSAERIITLNSAGWWLKDPLAPGRNMQIVVDPSFSFRRKEPQQVYEPLGRATSVVVTDGVKGIEGSLGVWVKTAARYAKLEALLSAGRTLWLEDSLGRWWYVKVSAAAEWSIVRAAPASGETTPIRHIHLVTLPITEVGRPTGEVITPGTPTG